MSTLPKDEASRAAPLPVVPAPPPAAGAARPPPGASLAPGAVIDGRYRVIRFLNQGASGVVHEVEHVRTGRRLAMKTLVEDASAARLEQEARATSLMRNAHVVKITDMGPPPGGRGAPYLVMELLDGQSLRELLDEAGQLPLEMTVNIALQVCECLAEAHERKVIHRDLKPENLFLVKSAWPGHHDVVVLDFGVMKVAGEGPIPRGSLTRTGSTVGTPYYMSLEQLRNSSNVDARADVYSLGVVLYECLAGRKPFVADTIGDLVYALCSGPPTSLARLRPDLPAEVCDLVMRTLRMNRDDRPADMTELGAALLPHGHQAFGLWIRSGQGAPAPLDAAPKPIGAAPAPAAIAPAPPTPDEEEAGTTLTAVAPYRADPLEAARPAEVAPLAAVPAPPLLDSAGEGVPTGPIPALGAAPAAPGPAARSDRDTPTEMYVGFRNDRDTPTRALPIPSFPDEKSSAGAHRPAAGAPAYLPEPAASPGEPAADPAEQGATHRMLGPEARAVIQAAPPVTATLRSMPGPGGLPPTAELPRFNGPMEPRATGAHPAAVLPEPVKPGWQRSLDAALASAGGFMEGVVQKVRAQPPPVQYAVIGSAGLVALLLVVLFFVLVFG